MFGMGMGELIVIAIVALLFLGPEKLPEAAKTISKGIRDFRKQTRELQQTIEDDNELGSAIRDLKSALRGDEILPSQRQRMAADAARKLAENNATSQAPAAADAAVAADAAAQPAAAESAAVAGMPLIRPAAGAVPVAAAATAGAGDAQAAAPTSPGDGPAAAPTSPDDGPAGNAAAPTPDSDKAHG